MTGGETVWQGKIILPLNSRSNRPTPLWQTDYTEWFAEWGAGMQNSFTHNTISPNC